MLDVLCISDSVVWFFLSAGRPVLSVAPPVEKEGTSEVGPEDSPAGIHCEATTAAASEIIYESSSMSGRLGRKGPEGA